MNGAVGAAGFLQHVGQDGQVLEAALVVDRLGDVHGGAITSAQPSGIDLDGAEGVAEEVAEQVGFPSPGF